MTYEEMLHCIRAVANVTGEDELYVLGSQSILLSLDEYQLPSEAVLSREVDIATVHNATNNAYIIAGTFHEGSDFHSSFDLEIDGIQLDEILLPVNWEDRAVEYQYDIDDDQVISIYAPDLYDIAAGKLYAHREKDRRWLVALYENGIIDMHELFQRVGLLEIDYDYYNFLVNSLQSIINGTSGLWRI